MALDVAIADEAFLEPILRLSRDEKASAALMRPDQVRYLVDLYYQLQNERIRAAAQARTLDENGEPNAVLSFYFRNFEVLEGDIRRALAKYSESHPLGRWAESITGIGPVISSGLLAHIDIAKAPTAGHIWRFAGLDPTLKWEKSQKRPWNARLKTLCWKIGESFVKVSNNKNDVYGHVYAARKVLEIERNEAGLFKDQAEAILAAKRIGKDTDAYRAYSEGKLPPAHIHARAKRYAVKLFLANYQEVGYFLLHTAMPPKPYVLEHLGHVDWFQAPNADLVPGLPEAQKAARP